MAGPQPFAFAPSQSWHGHDGNWSSFTVRVGTPEQNFRILPSAATGAIILPDYRGCQPDAGDPSNCGELRGVFESNNQTLGWQSDLSVTWNPIDSGLSLFQTGLQGYLGYAANASFGDDSVGLMVQNSDGPTLVDQLVGSLKKLPFFVGFLGLDPMAINFTTYDRPQRSFLVALRDEKKIPSLSYAYNAGAYYRTPKVFGSLTLGGYDETRFISSNVTFPFDNDDQRPTSLKLQRITGENTLNGSVSILQEETYVNLDFTLPYLWLPHETCDRIATYFGLTYDDTSKLYFLDDKTHEELIIRKPVLSFEFGDTATSTIRVGIEIPYTAFDLQASWPLVNTTQRYFPIRRANTPSQYTLGRAFMQEAYIIVDYERGNFSLHQAVFPTSNEHNIVAISSKDSAADAKSRALSRASIAGIVSGVSAFCVLLALSALWCFRRRNRGQSIPEQQLEELGCREESQERIELPETELKEIYMSNVALELSGLKEDGPDSKLRSELA
ncbi:hypothetical protein E8E13_009889 [Curvularia kusanoi]|uniref:Peptidase A1 domain-containing protein n=1 Tax=Curvularia kusanoi TaxID=90978 RepID=A0A9P4TG16_CURKU|nr:hypothetical protein E8E13_009889 [Curvularia kusanoi]